MHNINNKKSPRNKNNNYKNNLTNNDKDKKNNNKDKKKQLLKTNLQYKAVVLQNAQKKARQKRKLPKRQSYLEILLKLQEKTLISAIKKQQTNIKNYADNLVLGIFRSTERIQILQEITQLWEENELQKFAKTRDAYRQFADNWERIQDLNTRVLREKIALEENEHYITLLQSVIIAKKYPEEKPHEFFKKINFKKIFKKNENNNDNFAHLNETLNLQKKIKELANNPDENENGDEELKNYTLNSILEEVKKIIEPVNENILVFPNYEIAIQISGELRKDVIEISRYEHAIQLISTIKQEIKLAEKIIKNCILLRDSTDLKALNKLEQFMKFLVNKQKMKSTPEKKAIYTLETVDQYLKE